MATESLIVELDAKTGRLEAALKRTEERLEGLEDQTKKNDSAFGSFTKVAAGVGNAVTLMGTAIIAAGTALSTMVVMTAKGEQELQAMSRQAKLTTGDFEALAFATKQYGINAEQVADISKDISDKLGEFARDGKGPFEDFVNTVGLTTEEGMKLAEEFGQLSSDQVILEMANQLEQAGASADVTTQVFESMGNDLSKLTPLFANNGKELNALTKRYNEINAQLGLTAEEAEKLKESATSFDLLTESIGNGTKLIAAQFAPALNEFFNGVIDVVPRATQVVVDFINSFKSPEQITQLESLNNLIEDQENAISRLQGKIAGNENVIKTYYGDTTAQVEANKLLNQQLTEEEERLVALWLQREEIIEQQKRMDDAKKGEGGTISATLGTGGEGEDPESEAEKEKLDTMLSYWEEYAASRLAIQNELYLESQGLGKMEVKDNELVAKSQGISAKEGTKLASAANKAFFEDNKAIKAGLIVSDTAAAAMSEYAKGGPWAAAAAIAFGGIQLANLLSASPGGGGSVSSAAPDTVTQQTQPEDFGTIDLNNVDVSGQALTIRIEGSGDEITEAIYKNMKVMQIEGNL